MNYKKLYVAIIGCGRLGASLANKLSHNGSSVIIVDPEESSFCKLSSEFTGFRFEGDATRISVLKEIGLDKADILIAATHSDNVNLMVAQIAKKMFKINHAFARIYDPCHKELCDQAGVKAICTTQIASQLFLQALDESLNPGRSLKP